MATESSRHTLRLWAFGDAHVGTDKRNGRDSLAEAIIHSESGGTEGGPPFAWDIAIDVGDMSGAEGVPQDAEGEEVVRQFHALRHHKKISTMCVATMTAVVWMNPTPGGGKSGWTLSASTRRFLE